MTVIAAYPVVRASLAKRECQSVQAIEKIKPRAEFNGKQDGRREPQSWICMPYERAQSCQSGTAPHASNWDGPPLSSQFAAQVLGQALGTNVPKPSAGAAYAKPAFRLLPLFDQNI